MQNPTIPAWLAMGASAALVVIPILTAQANIPSWAVTVLGALAALATYVAHLNTSRSDADKIAKLGGGLIP
jgi:hypothetical protein